MRTIPALLLAATVALACRRPGPPSAEYEQARMRRLALVAQWADDADARPEMDEVLALLDRVAPDSSDAAAAAELRTRIVESRERAAAREEERRRMAARAAAAADWPAGAGAPGAGGASGGERGPPALVPGLKLEDFRSAYGDCFRSSAPIQIDVDRGGDAGVASSQGEAFTLDGTEDCRERYPAHVDRVVLFAQGALVSVEPASRVTRTEVKEVVPMQREVWGARLPDGGIEVLDAGPLVPVPRDGGAR